MLLTNIFYFIVSYYSSPAIRMKEDMVIHIFLLNKQYLLFYLIAVNEYFNNGSITYHRITIGDDQVSILACFN